MYSVGVRDSIMIAHSFTGSEFGPATQLHGATYTVDCEFRSAALVEKLNWVVNIGEAQEVLSDVLKQYHFKNLDEVPDLANIKLAMGEQNQNTTTEYMAQMIHRGVAERFKGRFSGDIKVTLWESHKAWGSYTAPAN